MFTKLARKQEGFTLIELLVVVAIIALLAAFAVPRLFSAMDAARKAPGTADIQTIADSMERYFVEPTHRQYPTTDVTEDGTLGNADDNAQETAITNLLVGTYLKNGTTFKNGYKKGFVYLTNDKGKYFFLVDPRNYSATDTLKVFCGDVGATADTGTTVASTDGKTVAQWVSPSFTVGADFKVVVQSTSATDPTSGTTLNEATAIPSSDVMKQGCHVAKYESNAWTELSGGTGTADSVQLITF